MKLYEIGEELERIEALLWSRGGEIDDTEEGLLIEQWLDDVRQAQNAKINSMCGLIRNLETWAEIRKAEAKRFTEMARADQNKADRLTARLKAYFERHGIERLKTAQFEPRLVNAGGALPVIVEIEPALLPKEYKRVTVEADKKAIGAALGQGEAIEGCRLGVRAKVLKI